MRFAMRLDPVWRPLRCNSLDQSAAGPTSRLTRSSGYHLDRVAPPSEMR